MDNRKKIGILVVAAVVALVVIGLIVASMLTGSKSVANQALSVDADKHTGVERLLSVKQVNEALGDLGKDAKEPKLSGTVNTSEFRGETASYEFKTPKDKTAIVDVETRIFPNPKAMKEREPFKETEESLVEGVAADEARYFVPRAYSADHQVALIATKDNKIFKFSVMQNANQGIDINQQAAKRIVLRLAKAADFEAIK